MNHLDPECDGSGLTPGLPVESRVDLNVTRPSPPGVRACVDCRLLLTLSGSCAADPVYINVAPPGETPEITPQKSQLLTHLSIKLRNPFTRKPQHLQASKSCKTGAIFR